MIVNTFMTIFDGLKEAHGYFTINGQSASGKATGKAGISREPRTMKTW